MTPTLSRRDFSALLAGTLASIAWPASALTYPTRPVRVIVPFAAGGPVDVAARLLGERFRQTLGQPFLVDNRAGAGGNVGMAALASAPADGHTLAINGNSYAVNFSLYGSLPFRQSDFVPVGMVVSAPLVLVVPGTTPYRDLREMLADAKKQANAFSYASGGVGTIGHLGMHLLAELADTRMVHVPYKGAVAAMQDLIGGQVQLYLTTVTSVLPLLQSGRIKPLMVTSRQRLNDLPGVPTAAEAGVPDMTVDVWQVLLAAAATPGEIVSQLNASLNEALATPEVRRGLGGHGLAPFPGTSAEAASFLRMEVDRWSAVVRRTGARAE